jgi:hypothetical protein
MGWCLKKGSYLLRYEQAMFRKTQNLGVVVFVIVTAENAMIEE